MVLDVVIILQSHFLYLDTTVLAARAIMKKYIRAAQLLEAPRW